MLPLELTFLKNTIFWLFMIKTKIQNDLQIKKHVLQNQNNSLLSISKVPINSDAFTMS
jgi:hypothetical protein